jgi:hypothetical protein
MSHVDAFPNILIFGVRLEYISYSFFIAVFFVASGYTFSNHGSVSDNINRRFKRLIIPYFRYSLLLFFICFMKDIITGKLSLQAIVRAVEGIVYSRAWLYSRDFGPENTVSLFTIYNGTLWFLTAMFLASVVFYLIINKCEKNELYFAIYILCFLIITAACIKIPILLPWSLDTFLLGTLFMMVGYRLKKKEYFSKQFKVPDAISVCIMFWFLWILIMYNGCGNMSVREFGPHHYISVIVYAGAGCIGSILCLWFSKLIEKTFLVHF